MSKRTRIAVVAAALLLAMVGPAVSGAVGNDGVVAAGMMNGRFLERLSRGLRIILGGSDDLARGLRASRHLDSVIGPVVIAKSGDTLIPTAEERAYLYQLACQIKYVHELEREQEAWWRLVMLGEKVKGAVGYAASVANLSRELKKAEDNGDRVWKVAGATFCTAAEANLKHYRR
jgi:hypothetical protein